MKKLRCSIPGCEREAAIKLWPKPPHYIDSDRQGYGFCKLHGPEYEALGYLRSKPMEHKPQYCPRCGTLMEHPPICPGCN